MPDNIQQEQTRRLATIMAADILGYSRLMGADEEGTYAALHSARSEIIEPKIKKHKARIVKHTGDGFLAEFPTVLSAVKFALEMQEEMARRAKDAPKDLKIKFRIGINLGDIIVDKGGDIFGDGVNIACRLETLGIPGGICISGTVFEVVHKKLKVKFDDLGGQKVKNIPEKVHAYDIRWPGEGGTPEERAVKATSKRKSMVQMAGAAVAAVALIWIAFWQFGPGDFQEIVQSASAVGDINVNTPVPGFNGRAAIAVLPFVNLSGDADQEYFADGLTEDIITALQTYRGFPVIARTSTFAYKGVAKDVRQIARELGVGYIVEGSVRKSGDQIRITAQLIDASGRHLWAKSYDSSLSGLVAAEDEIVGQIVNAIEPELFLAETGRVRSVRSENLEAFDYYLRALAESTILFGYSDLHGQPVTLERNDLARQLALKAIEIDPQLTRAYALISHIEAEMIHMYRAEITDEEAAVAIERAIRFGNKARQISPFDSTACSCLAFVLLNIGDVALALDIQKAAVAANPSHSNARAVYAWALLYDGQNEAAFEEIELAKRLSPRDMAMSFYLTTETFIHLALGNLEMAAIRVREAISISSLNYDAKILRILVLDVMGREDEARAVLSAFLAEKPNFIVKSLWNAPVADVLLGEAAASLSADERPGFHEFVAERLAQLGWQN